MSNQTPNGVNPKNSTSVEHDSPLTSLGQRSSNSSTRLTRTTIREANTHLQMLHARNQELEQIVNEQNEELHRKDLEYVNLSRAHQLLERHCQQLQALLDDRTRRLYVFERKEAVFRETLELKPAIEALLDVLNTFEQEDSASSSMTTTATTAITTKPLQFVQSSSQNKNANVIHRTDDV